MINYYFIPMIFLLVGIWIFLGKILEDRYFNLFAGFLLCMLGLYTVLNGLYDITDVLLTMGFNLIVIGLGFYLLGYNGIKLIQEGMD